METHGGADYFRVSYFGNTMLLRVNPEDGAVVMLDPASGKERPFASLGLAEGATFPTEMDPCPTMGTIVSRNASVKTPAGEFANAVEVRYRAACPDVGSTRQIWAPNVGLVRQEETSFAGPRMFELIYFRAGALTGGEPELSFTAAVDSAVYKVGAKMNVRLTLRSTGPESIRLYFPSGQSFELKIMNEKGEIVYTWSRDKAFILIIREEMFGPGEKNYGFTAELEGLPPGKYTAQAYLTTQPIEFMGQVGFEIVR
jgi:hypothetical protein